MKRKKHILVCNLSSIDTPSFFEEQYPDFTPLDGGIIFLNNENFLMTPYSISDNTIHAIFWTESGDQLQFTNISCGYHGAGPNTAAQILKFCGFPDPMVSKIFELDAVSLDFKKKTVNYAEKYLFFRSKIRKAPSSGFLLDKYSKINISDKSVVMINPQRANLQNFFNALVEMEPKRMMVSFSKKRFYMKNLFCSAKLYDDRDEPAVNYSQNTEHPNQETGVNFAVYGQKFDLFCSIEYRYLAEMAELSYMQITHHKLNLFQIPLHLRHFFQYPLFSGLIRRFRFHFLAEEDKELQLKVTSFRSGD